MSGLNTKRLEMLLMPVPGEAPTGTDLRRDNSARSLYFQLKDARTAARASERAAEAAGEVGGLAAEWRTVFDIAQTSIAQHSKDLEIAAWLIEVTRAPRRLCRVGDRLQADRDYGRALLA